MKHISIIVPQGHFSMVNVEGAYQMFSSVNEFLDTQGEEPALRVELVGVEEEIRQPNGLFSIKPHKTIDQVKETNLIIVPAIHGDNENNLRINARLSNWLVAQYKQGAEIASLCVASFFLASTGLLDNRVCSTHWRYANQFRKMYPKAILMDDKILTEADGIYTSGGAYSFTNLLLYLIEKYTTRAIAVQASKTFMIDIDRSSQSPFIIFSGQKMHKDSAVLRVQEYIEENYRDKIIVEELCEKIAQSRRTFERHFKKATSNTIMEYIQRVKVEAAKKELESGRKTVGEVMFEVGYSDPKAFRDVFRKVVNMTPGDYMTKYKT